MSDATGIVPGPGGGIAKLLGIFRRAKNVQGTLARIYPIYQRLQVERFQTENSSEGGAWLQLDPTYKKYKERRYGGGLRRKSRTREAGAWNSYPGKGSKMMIGTGMLAGAAIGPSSGSPFTEGVSNHRAIFTTTGMTISIEESGQNPDGSEFIYPHFAAVHRPFMTFGETSLDEMREAAGKYILSQEGASS